MNSAISEETMSAWNKVVRLWHEYFNARRELAEHHRAELSVLVKQELGSPSSGHLAFEMAKILTPEERQTLLPALIALCSSGRYAGSAKEVILDMSQDWLLQNIERAAEPTLTQNDFLDWVNILDIYNRIDPGLGRRLAERMTAHSDPELREWGQEFLNEQRSCLI